MTRLTFIAVASLCGLFAGCSEPDFIQAQNRPTDTAIGGYIIKPGQIKIRRTAPDRIGISAPKGTIEALAGTPDKLLVVVWNSYLGAIARVSRSGGPSQKLDGFLVGSFSSSADGSLLADLPFSPIFDHLVLIVTRVRDTNEVPIPVERSATRTTAAYTSVNGAEFLPPVSLFSNEGESSAVVRQFTGKDIWSSSAELATVPMSGTTWDAVYGASLSDLSSPVISQQDNSTSENTLAAALVYARSSTQYATHKTRVVQAIENLVAMGIGNHDYYAIARSIPAFVEAADLVGYRSQAFVDYLRALSETWRSPSANVGLRQVTNIRVDRQAMFVLTALASMDVYLGNESKLVESAAVWKTLVSGPVPAPALFNVGLSWQLNPAAPVLINPKGAKKMCAGTLVDVDGVMPVQLGETGDCGPSPDVHYRNWTTLQAIATYARILDRQGISLWEHADEAIRRATNALLVRDNPSGHTYSWLLLVVDRAYGTDWSCALQSDPSSSAGRGNGWWWILEKDLGARCSPDNS